MEQRYLGVLEVYAGGRDGTAAIDGSRYDLAC
jgi:hypothetical protein